MMFIGRLRTISCGEVSSTGESGRKAGIGAGAAGCAGVDLTREGVELSGVGSVGSMAAKGA
jgi:hypothetical protein